MFLLVRSMVPCFGCLWWNMASSTTLLQYFAMRDQRWTSSCAASWAYDEFGTICSLELAGDESDREEDADALSRRAARALRGILALLCGWQRGRDRSRSLDVALRCGRRGNHRRRSRRRHYHHRLRGRWGRLHCAAEWWIVGKAMRDGAASRLRRARWASVAAPVWTCPDGARLR